jgi:hypothetical protein
MNALFDTSWDSVGIAVEQSVDAYWQKQINEFWPYRWHLQVLGEQEAAAHAERRRLARERKLIEWYDAKTAGGGDV